ncbi:MAG: IS5 family transposase [Myxococcales bacterium]|nr:IS5 family transposase [Myxococcales bacterium]
MAKTRMPRHQLTDAQWELVADLFPTCVRKSGRRPRDRRQILDAIFWVLRTGAPWRDVPGEYCPWSTAWDFFDKWNKDGTFDEMLRRLRSISIPHDAEPSELWCIDGTSIRAARCAAGGGKSRRTTRASGSRSGAFSGWLGHENPHSV